MKCSITVLILGIISGIQCLRSDKWLFQGKLLREEIEDRIAHPVPVPITEKQAQWFQSLSQRSRSRSSLPVRSELRTLSSAEWQSVTDAIWSAMTSFPDPDDSKSEYDVFVSYHLFTNSPAAHMGAAFLPWHREFLVRYETMLLSHGMTVGLPYWDLTLDSYLEDPYWSVVWGDGLLGNSRGVVESGPFALFPVLERCVMNPNQGFIGSSTIERVFQNSSYATDGGMYTDEDLEFFYSRTQYRELCRFKHPEFEHQHDMGHRVISGQMSDVECSPSDPVFFIYHNYIDYIWEEFRIHHQETDVEIEYPETNIGGPLHAADAPMRPFEPLINIDGLHNHYTQDDYTFSQPPITCVTSSDCNSVYLRCDNERSRCLTRLRSGAPCTGEVIDECMTDCVDLVCT